MLLVTRSAAVRCRTQRTKILLYSNTLKTYKKISYFMIALVQFTIWNLRDLRKYCRFKTIIILPSPYSGRAFGFPSDRPSVRAQDRKPPREPVSIRPVRGPVFWRARSFCAVCVCLYARASVQVRTFFHGYSPIKRAVFGRVSTGPKPILYYIQTGNPPRPMPTWPDHRRG